MILPDYDGGSIANLMRTLAEACGAQLPAPVPLAAHYGLSARELARARNIVLFVVDGLGADQLMACGSGALRRYAGRTLTSVFPSTTAAAIPTFMTGLPPARHGLTGWHMWLDEMQAVTAILPLSPRSGPPFAETPAQVAAKLFEHSPLYVGMHRPAWVISPREIAFSPFNAYHSRGADTLAYADLDGLMHTLAGVVRIPGRKFVYAYWPTLDSTAHHFGCDSREARATLARLCTAFDALLEEIAGTDTRIIVTADHGFIDSPAQRIVELDDHPEFAQLLARPLCGEARVAWCYPKAGAAADLVRYASDALGACCDVVSRARMLDEGWFGPGPTHPHLASRIGEFALVMRDNWTIKDWLPGERRHTLIGVHGGTSEAEMRVPLLAIDA